MSSLRNFRAWAVLIVGIFFAAGTASASVCTWNGNVSSAWADGGNWTACAGVQPQSGDSVIIGAGAPNDPILTTTAPTSGNLSSITVGSAGKLDISSSGVLNTNASFSLNGGRLTFSFDGTLNVGPTAETNLIYTTGSTLIFVPGATGALNIGGRLSPNAASDTITYNQTSGTVRVALFASSDATFGAFSIPASGSTFQMSSTAAIIQREPTAIAQDYVNLAATSNSVTGGLVQFGDGSTVAGSPHYAINSAAPVFNLTLSAISGLRVNIRDNTIPVLGTLSILTGAQLDDADTVPKGASVGGDWINNGTFTSQDVLGGAGLITFNGGATQNISGSSPTTFHDLTINSSGVVLGQTITVTGTLTLTSGNITTNSNTVVIGSAGTVSRTSGHIIGNLRKTYSAPASKTFEVGTANGFSPVDVNITAGSGDFTVKATQGPQPNVATPTRALQRYWTLTAVGMTGDLTFHYLDPPDVPGTANENNFIIYKYNGSFTTPGGSVNTAANTATITGVSSFSDWTLAEPNAPTAANGAIAGRIVDSNGSPVAGAVVRLSGTQNRKFITDANGFYRFDNVETNGFYTVTPSRVNYTFSPGERSFSQLGETTQAVFGATVTSGNYENPLDTPEYFVRQHYVDFLGREPDEAGFNFWSDQIIGCGLDQECIGRKRENVSAAYFLSIEFQETGGLVDGLYRASFDRAPKYAEFLPDSATIGKDVIVGRTGWEQQLAANKQAFLDAFVGRPAFQSVYGGLSNDQYVDQLLTHTGIIWTQAERAGLVNGLASGTLTRAGVLGQIAADQRFVAAKGNEAFVMMEYFGYLRRDPDAAGYQYWLNKLNQFNGNFEQAEMVKAFIVSLEYRQRFPR